MPPLTLHKIVKELKLKVFSITQSSLSTQSCVAHRRPVLPGQPDHMPTRSRGPVCSCLRSQHVPSTTTQHEQAYSPYRRTQNERHSAASVQIKLAGSVPVTLVITRKQQCLAWVRMSAPEYRTSTDARTVRRVALRNTAATVPSRSYVPTV